MIKTIDNKIITTDETKILALKSEPTKYISQILYPAKSLTADDFIEIDKPIENDEVDS